MTKTKTDELLEAIRKLPLPRPGEHARAYQKMEAERHALEKEHRRLGGELCGKVVRRIRRACGSRWSIEARHHGYCIRYGESAPRPVEPHLTISCYLRDRSERERVHVEIDYWPHHSGDLDQWIEAQCAWLAAAPKAKG